MTKLEKYISELKIIFNSRLKSIFVYGAKTNATSDKLNDDTNLMIITENLSGEDLKKCSRPTKQWIKGGIFEGKNPLPVIMDEQEWFNSADIYAMEYSDIKANNKIIFGENLIKNIEIKPEDLRFQCESETKNLLMKFRNHYLLYAYSPAQMDKSIVPVVKTINAIFKAILRINNIEPSIKAQENLGKVHDLCDIDKPFFEKLLCRKEKKCNFNRKETYELANKTVLELDKLLKYINDFSDNL